MRHCFIIATAIAIAGIVFVPQVMAQDDPTRTPTDRGVGTGMDRVDDTTVAPDAEKIRDTLAQVTEAAVTKGGLDDIVERFVDADRNRLGEGDVLTRTDEQLDGIVDQFRKNWQAKYNQEFDIKDEEQIYTTSFAMIRQGEIGDAARLARERETAPGTPPAGQPDVRPGPEADRVAGGDTNREPGRNIATVTIAESHGLPSLVIPMIHELPGAYKIDVPETLTAQQFRDNLADCFTKLNEKQGQWPSDVNDAYRHVSHKVLMACMNQKAEKINMGPGAMDRNLPGSDTPGQQPPR